MPKRMRSANLEQLTIHEISKALESPSELRATLHTVVNVLSKNLGVSRAMVTLVTPAGEIELVAASGTAGDDLSNGGDLHCGDASRAAPEATARPGISDTNDEQLCLNPPGSRADPASQALSLVGVPIRASGQDLGVLSCTRRPGELNGSFQHDVRLLSIVANLISEAVKLPAVRHGELDGHPAEPTRFH